MNPTMVTITHELKLAFELADRVALLDGGKILVDLPPREFEASDDRRVGAFVRGDSTGDDEYRNVEATA
jgi:phospholipid/cholesterol/gamma-HCH transport system ATP-binding protein